MHRTLLGHLPLRGVAAVGALASVAAIVSTQARAGVPDGFGIRPNRVEANPELDCSPFEADSSPTGWVCDPDPDERGQVVSTLRGQQCMPTRVSMNYYYTTAAGVRKSIPSALSYGCDGGSLHGPYQKQWIVYSGLSNREDPSRESGQHLAGQRSGTWSFQSVNGEGRAVVRTVRFEKGAVVGVSRITEASVLTEVACSSSDPTHSERLWQVSLVGANAEKVALAERALLACEQWSAATCEDYRKKGLFGEDVRCDCDVQCSRPGLCTLQRGQCVRPSSDSDCAALPVCRQEGLCHFDGNTCVATRDEACQRSSVCATDGLCTAKQDACVATSDEACAASQACKDHQRCRLSENRCVVDDPLLPRASATSRPSSPLDLPVQPGPRRNPSLWKAGIAFTVIGGVVCIGGLSSISVLKQDGLSQDEEIAAGVIAGTGAAIALFVGVPLIYMFGERQPVSPAKRGTVAVTPMIGPGSLGLRGQF